MHTTSTSCLSSGRAYVPFESDHVLRNCTSIVSFVEGDRMRDAEVALVLRVVGPHDRQITRLPNRNGGTIGTDPPP